MNRCRQPARGGITKATGRADGARPVVFALGVFAFRLVEGVWNRGQKIPSISHHSRAKAGQNAGSGGV